MRWWTRAGLACLFVSAIPISHALASDMRALPVASNRIVHGRIVDAEAYPSFVRIFSRFRSTGENVCGGVLSGTREAITAAHCVLGARAIRLEHPASNSQAWAYGYRLAVGHDSRTLRRDLAVLNLSRDFVDASHFAVATAIPYDEFDGIRADVVGYGTTEVGRLSTVLRKAELTGLSHAACVSAWGSVNMHDDLCALGSCADASCSAVSDSCGGDSGGPVFLSNTSQLVGIVSRGASDCGDVQYPGIYARIPGDLTWQTSTLAAGGARERAVPLVFVMVLLLR